MCGILGIVSYTGQPLQIDDAEIRCMRDSMQFRGPDDSGLLRIDPTAVLAHRRLSIRDPAHGQQPWVSDDGRFALTYNGELYNTAELAQRTRSHFPGPPRTHCDTEELMRLLSVFGVEGVRHLRGMYAAGLYDREQQRLLLFRDRFGVKPLYYMDCDGTIVFASSMAALLKWPGFRPRPFRPAMTHYLMTLRPELDHQTMIEGIRQVPPGCLLIADRGGVSIQQYWDYPQADEDISPGEVEQRLDERLRDAVQSRIVSDVPVGMMLSGGVDSSLLGTYVAESLGDEFVAECGIGRSDDGATEKDYAARAASVLKCRFRTVEVNSGDYRDAWKLLIGQTAQPLITPSDVVIYQLARSLKQRVGVVLGGEGADELLCGYTPIHGIGRDYDLQRQLERRIGSEANADLAVFQQSLLLTYQGGSLASLAEAYFTRATIIPPTAIAMLTRDSIDDLREIRDYYTRQLTVDDGAQFGGMAAMTRFLHRDNLQALLLRLDQATMAASLEARVPYTDHRLIEAIWSTPLEHRFRVQEESRKSLRTSSELDALGLLESKAVLRDLARRRLPDDLANRRKASFPTPVLNWLQSDWKDWAADTLRESQFLRENFQAGFLQELSIAPDQAGFWTWPLLNLALWSEEVFGY
ncbi:asparagine synthase (glutamine-hydrolyzing) [Rubinisphaera margarita]|uniref:asparagine synthase (glutamine-hydrolyzing) n=1 Tax=Rubinisphaera margarita TaxID=2909586 RepID=UPI001EE7D64E|nr:asparagine synthase (glutamine-hydrolyzing) [Rubinisphaera margarita]MCG6158401.1 asparagine synthase (glutamine-hydrolyzing) [Rubinisphaera margarita]